MKININVKRKFKINGKEYNSVEEMPDDIREAFKKSMVSQADSGQKINPAVVKTKIIFNDTEYESVDVMPQDVYQLYEKLLKAAETGTAPSDLDLAKISNGALRGTDPTAGAHSEDIRQTAKIEPSFSPKRLIMGVILVIVIFGLYFLFHGR